MVNAAVPAGGNQRIPRVSRREWSDGRNVHRPPSCRRPHPKARSSLPLLRSVASSFVADV
eukprot:scaffold100855_cov55-Attheya_sp.AAC.1